MLRKLSNSSPGYVLREVDQPPWLSIPFYTTAFRDGSFSSGPAVLSAYFVEELVNFLITFFDLPNAYRRHRLNWLSQYLISKSRQLSFRVNSSDKMCKYS